jgi:polyphosphate kinase
MMRNLSQRVEIAFLIENDKLKKRVIKEAFYCSLEDNMTSWILNSDGTYQKSPLNGQEPNSLQTVLLNRLTMGK